MASQTSGKSGTSVDLLRQSEALRQQAEALKAKEIPAVVVRMKEAIAHYGLTAEQLGLSGTAVKVAKVAPASLPAPSPKPSPSPSPASSPDPRRKPPVRASVVIFRDAAGHAWTGFGPRPRWLKEAIAAGASEESLRVS